MTGLPRLYLKVTKESFRSFAKSPLAMVGLAAATVVVILISTLTAPLGIVGGFIVGFTQAAAIGFYLYLIGLAVSGKRRVGWSDLQDGVGTFLWEVISILFIFMFVEILLYKQDPSIRTGVVLLTTLIFNPVPELIYIKGKRSIELLSDSTRFMQENWPEWLGAHLFVAVGFGSWLLFISGTPFELVVSVTDAIRALNLEAVLVIVSPYLNSITSFMKMFGPWFGFLHAPLLALKAMGGGSMGFLNAIVLLLLTHWFMLFRGHLFIQLSVSSKRSRAWKAKTR